MNFGSSMVLLIFYDAVLKEIEASRTFECTLSEMTRWNMKNRISSQSRLAILLFLTFTIHSLPPAVIASRNVTLEFIEIFKTHEWFARKPTVYFCCKGENKTYLPDVKEKNHSYIFKGHESWQPLTALPDHKCKRCGFYEEDRLTSDDTFDEWELCPEDFSPPPNGRYVHYNARELNATFLCPLCHAYNTGSGSYDDGSGNLNYSNGDTRTRKMILIIFIIFLSLVALSTSAVFVYKLWQKRRRDEQAARFLKLFEEEDDFGLVLHDEL